MTMNTASSPSVVILRSTCDLARTRNKNLNLYDAFPLTCDMAILPELDNISPSLLVRKQGLNPCGVTNVLLLQDLSPGEAYLMSLSNCVTIAGNTEFPITLSPSTFFFETPHGSILQENGVIINTKRTSIKLEVAFDMSALQDHFSQERDLIELSTAPPVQETVQPSLNDTATNHNPPLMSHNNHNDILRVLQTLAEREARDVDRMLNAFGAVFLLLVAMYVWTVLSIMKKNQVKQLVDYVKEKFSVVSAILWSTISRKSPSSNDSVHSGEPQGTTNKGPPVNSIVFDRNVTDPPSLAEERKIDSFPVKGVPVFIPRQNGIRSRLVSPQPLGKPVESLRDKASSSCREHRDLSPCSRLAKDWEEKKSARRSKRRCGVRVQGNTRTLMPIVVSEGTSTLDQSAPRKTIVPLANICGTPKSEICPTSVSDESFLNDYW